MRVHVHGFDRPRGNEVAKLPAAGSLEDGDLEGAHAVVLKRDDVAAGVLVLRPLPLDALAGHVLLIGADALVVNDYAVVCRDGLLVGLHVLLLVDVRRALATC